MGKEAAIKGSIVAGHAEVFQKYVDTRGISRDALLERFTADDLSVLQAPIEATAWYGIAFYARLLEFLRDHPGEGDNQYLVDAGRRSAENLIRAGVHQQLEYLKRTQHNDFVDAKDRSEAFGRDLRLLNSISASIVNFSESVVVPDPEHELRWVISKRDAADYPEVLCWSTQGFCNRMAEEHDANDLWFWERPRPDVVDFRMNREV